MGVSEKMPLSHSFGEKASRCIARKSVIFIIRVKGEPLYFSMGIVGDLDWISID
jgi:hypothetical protein